MIDDWEYVDVEAILAGRPTEPEVYPGVGGRPVLHPQPFSANLPDESAYVIDMDYMDKLGLDPGDLIRYRR